MVKAGEDYRPLKPFISCQKWAALILKNHTDGALNSRHGARYQFKIHSESSQHAFQLIIRLFVAF